MGNQGWGEIGISSGSVRGRGLNELALFAGAGGGILGGTLLGWRTVCAVEIEPYPASVLCQRQNDGFLPPFPIWDDVRTFDGKPWRGIVDVISGGFPCQDISAAGRGAGIEGERSGLWKEYARIIGEVRPRFVLVENSPLLTLRGLDRVLGDLSALGYDAQWGVISAADAGAPHLRERIWIVAYSEGYGLSRSFPALGRDWKSLSDINGKLEEGVKNREQFRDGIRECGKSFDVADAYEVQRNGSRGAWDGRDESTDGGQAMAYTPNGGNVRRDGKLEPAKGQVLGHRRGQEDGRGEWWAVEPDVGRVAHGVAARVDRLKAIGNGQVPAVVRLAWEALA